jgi:hypothetical protein
MVEPHLPVSEPQKRKPTHRFIESGDPEPVIPKRRKAAQPKPQQVNTANVTHSNLDSSDQPSLKPTGVDKASNKASNEANIAQHTSPKSPSHAPDVQTHCRDKESIHNVDNDLDLDSEPNEPEVTEEGPEDELGEYRILHWLIANHEPTE